MLRHDILKQTLDNRIGTTLTREVMVSNDSAAYLTHDSKTADHLDAADNTCLKHSPSAFIEEVHLIDEQQCHLCMHRVSFKMARIQILGTQVQFHESSLLSV